MAAGAKRTGLRAAIVAPRVARVAVLSGIAGGYPQLGTEASLGLAGDGAAGQRYQGRAKQQGQRQPAGHPAPAPAA